MVDSSAPVIWITGFSGAGKTTIAQATRGRLLAEGHCCVLLDGDRLRAVLGKEAGHTRDERMALALTYSRLCRELSSQGVTVICATISLFEEVWAWNRAHLPKYLEVYLRVPLDVRAARDAKGLYARQAQNMVGVDVVLNEPHAPDLVIDNHGPLEVAHAVDLVVQRTLPFYAGAAS